MWTRPVTGRRLCDLGHGDSTVRRERETVPVARLADVPAAETLRISALFDVRNGSSSYGDRMRSVLTAERYATPVKLNVR